MRLLAIIPARSGSKGLKDKNIKELWGKPLLAYSIEAALKARIFDCVHLSTDSRKYAEIGIQYGADVPFLRSLEISSDTAGSWDVVLYVLEKYEEMGQKFDTVMLLQPTSPLRDVGDILGAYAEYKEKNAKAVVSVSEMDHSPLWSNTLPKDLSMDGFIRHDVKGGRQLLAPYYRLNGAIYMVNVEFLRESQMIYRNGCYAYIMKRENGIDIDTQLDFDMAEYILKNVLAKKV